jgi:hypothetical protein
MDKINQRETVIARLIANTHRQKRPNSIVEIASDIRWLQNDLGSLRAVAETIGISTDMLRQFLSVERLCPEVQKLVAEREIDLVNIVHYMRNFDAKAQQIIANEVIAERLSANDIRALAPFRKSHPDLVVNQLISRVKKSKDIQIYVAYFRLPTESKNIKALKVRFEKIIGRSEIESFTVKDLIGTLELTSLGEKRLREAAKNHNLSLRKFVDSIVLEQ